MTIYRRISGRTGNQIDLDVSFYRGGVLTDPYAIRTVDIYHTQILAHNRVAQVIINAPCEETGGYPSPVEQITEDVPAGNCGTDPVTGSPIPGRYRLTWDVPADALAPAVYHDVWSYFPSNPCADSDLTACDTECPDLDDDEFSGSLLQCCNRFWIYPDSWLCSDGLQTVRFGFEPQDQRFHLPEIRPLEVGLTPLPLYDYNYNLVMPMIPYLQASITIQTVHREVLVDNAAMEIGIRQGSYKSNPFLVKYLLDTSNFLIGTYHYRITLTLPDGSTRVSPSFVLTIG